MPDHALLECPNCDLQMTVIPLGVPSQVTCPNCFQRILLVPGKPPQKPSGRQLENFDSLPQMTIVSTPVAGPAKSDRIIRRAARKAHAHANRDVIQQTRRRRIRLAVTGLVCAIAIGIFGSLGFLLLGKVPEESWAAVIPGIETPKKIVREYANVCEAFRETCDTIDSERSRDTAIQSIAYLTARMRGIADRIDELGPPTAEQLESLDPQWMTRARENSEWTLERVQVLRGERMLLNGEFLTTLQKHIDATNAAVEAMINAWHSNNEENET